MNLASKSVLTVHCVTRKLPLIAIRISGAKKSAQLIFIYRVWVANSPQTMGFLADSVRDSHRSPTGGNQLSTGHTQLIPYALHSKQRICQSKWAQCPHECGGISITSGRRWL